MNKQFIPNKLRLMRLGIDTHKEYVVYMPATCHICISEGFEAMTRIQVTVNKKTIIATLHVVHDNILQKHEASLSESAWKILQANVGDEITFNHLLPVVSLRHVRSKMHGNRLNAAAFKNIIEDIAQGKYSNIELAAFVTACVGDNLDVQEIIDLTLAMINVGESLSWSKDVVVDKHCVGGLPGNRTTPIVVAIIAASGLSIPKTSSRAITSPAGTADVMETMTSIELSAKAIQKVVRKTGGCIAWGGAVALSPADDVIIKIEKALDIDSDGQLVASVLSKKVAAGSTHVVIDIPYGKTAKIRTEEAAEKLKYYFTVVGKAVGLNIKTIISDGSQPVGKGIGPALEALDVLTVLRNEENAPNDLRKRAVTISAAILELAGKVASGNGKAFAEEQLSSGNAYKKFMEICLAQGGFKEPVTGHLTYEVRAKKSGTIQEIDNRKLAKIAKLSGAPNDAGAGVLFNAPLGKKVVKDQVLFTIFAESDGELEYAKVFLESQPDVITIG